MIHGWVGIVAEERIGWGHYINNNALQQVLQCIRNELRYMKWNSHNYLLLENSIYQIGLKLTFLALDVNFFIMMIIWFMCMLIYVSQIKSSTSSERFPLTTCRV